MYNDVDKLLKEFDVLIEFAQQERIMLNNQDKQHLSVYLQYLRDNIDPLADNKYNGLEKMYEFVEFIKKSYHKHFLRWNRERKIKYFI